MKDRIEFEIPFSEAGQKRLSYLTIIEMASGGKIQVHSLETDDKKCSGWREANDLYRSTGKKAGAIFSLQGKELVLDRYDISSESRKNGLAGGIVRPQETGVHEVRLEIKRKDGAGVCAWYEKRRRNTTFFWGMHISLPGSEAFDAQEIMFKPFLNPGKVIYVSPTFTENFDGMFLRSWSEHSKITNRAYKDNPLKEEFRIYHECGVWEYINITLRRHKEVEEYMITKKAKFPSPFEGQYAEVAREVFKSSSLTVRVPRTFPENLTHFDPGDLSTSEGQIFIFDKIRSLHAIIANSLPTPGVYQLDT